MLSKEDLQAISQLIKNEVEPINQRLDKMEEDIGVIKEDVKVLKEDVSVLKEDVEELKEDVEELKEDTEITRFSTNQLIKWVEFYYGKEKPFPIDEDEIENQDKILKMID